ncbi:MAG TPA: hypothetical protein VLV88_14920 [Terriglobales bacterium]|nr:hypothetical protein [Terriglobales bacterium]
MRVLAYFGLGVVLGLGVSGAPAQTVTATPETGVTPNVLLLYSAETVPGREMDYSRKEAEVAASYEEKKIPVYWLAMTSLTGNPHVLYFDGFDSFGDVEKTEGVIRGVLATHSDIVGMQQELLSYLNGSNTVLAFRRDDLGYRMNKVDLAKARYVRVTQVQLKTGTDADFAEAVKTVRHFYETNDVNAPWVIYQVDSGTAMPSYFQFQPMQSLKEMDDAYDRAKNSPVVPAGSVRQKLIQALQSSLATAEAETYSVNLKMSHLAPEARAGTRSEAEPVNKKQVREGTGKKSGAADSGSKRK